MIIFWFSSVGYPYWMCAPSMPGIVLGSGDMRRLSPCSQGAYSPVENTASAMTGMKIQKISLIPGFTFHGFSYLTLTSVWKILNGKFQKKKYISLKVYAILSSIMKSQDIHSILPWTWNISLSSISHWLVTWQPSWLSDLLLSQETLI